jgi:hypothetical protein
VWILEWQVLVRISTVFVHFEVKVLVRITTICVGFGMTGSGQKIEESLRYV